ncbi:MAG: glycosyltransferase family 4 protein [archaeon]
MRIAMITDVYYPYVKGGVEKRISEIAERLSQSHEVHVYCMKWWDGDKDLKVNDNLVLHGVCEPVELYDSRGKRKISQAVYFSMKLVKPLFDEDYDVIDCSQFPFFPLFVAKSYCILKKKPLVATWHEVWGRKYWRDYLGYVKGHIGYFVERAAVRMHDKYVVVSEHTRKKLLEMGVSADDMTVIPNGVDFYKIDKAGESAEKFDVLYAGRLIKHKNIDVLIEATAIVKKKFPRVSVGIIGKGSEKKRLVELALKMGVKEKICFLDSVDDVFSYMKVAKVFVLPSTREGFGMVVVEAHGCGLPVITVEDPSNAAKELVIDTENGYVVKLSAEEIAGRIADILMGEDAGMGKNGKESARKYGWDESAKRTGEVYRNVIYDGKKKD